jgi:hypothetical protein
MSRCRSRGANLRKTIPVEPLAPRPFPVSARRVQGLLLSFRASCLTDQTDGTYCICLIISCQGGLKRTLSFEKRP